MAGSFHTVLLPGPPIPVVCGAIADEDAGPVFKQLPFPDPDQVGLNLMFTQ